MPKIHPLKLWPTVNAPSMHEEESRVADLQATVEHYVPELAKSVAHAVDQKLDTIVIHQDAFAAGYDYDEFTLLGMMIKYAGLKGISVTVVGKAHETF